jgi:hypothetical protein
MSGYPRRKLPPRTKKNGALDGKSLEVVCQKDGLALKERSMWQVFKEFLLFLREEKKWWLVPLVILLLILGALIVFSSGSVLAPLMYPFL